MPRCAGEVMLRAMRSWADGGEVVVDALAVGLEAGLMPGGTELAAAANVGEDVDAAMLEPQLADVGGIVGRLGDLEAAIGVEQRGVGAVELHVLAMDDEVGDAGAVLGGGFDTARRHRWRRRSAAGSVFSRVSAPVEASPRKSEDGVRKLVMPRKKLSLASLVEITLTLALAGTGSAFWLQPVSVGV